MIFKYIQIARSLAKPGPHLCWQTQAMATWWTPGRDITSGTVWHCAQSSKLYIQVLSIPLAIPRLPGFESFSSESWSSINWWITLGPCLALAVSCCINLYHDHVIMSCSVMHHPAQCLERMTERIFLLAAMISFSKIKQQARTAWPILETRSSNHFCEREPCLMPNPLMQWS